MSKKRYGSLDFLKILATVSLIFHHYQQTFGVKFDNFINFCDGALYLGVLVELFFILSGFFMLPWVKRIFDGEPGSDFGSFASRRYRRILPMTALSVIVYELICYIAWRFFPEAKSGLAVIDLWGAVTSIFCAQSGWCFPNPRINNPIWYISALCLCYIIFYFTTWLAKKLKTNPVYGYIAVMLIGFAIKMANIAVPFADQWNCRGYISFFEGVLLAKLIEERDTDKTRYTVMSVGILAVTVYAFRNHFIGDYYAVTGFLVYPPIIFLMLRKPVARLFSSKIWSTLGNIQFHAYLWHVPILLVLDLLRSAGVNIKTGAVGEMFLFAAIVEAFAAFSYFALEKNMDRVYCWIVPKKKTQKGELS